MKYISLLLFITIIALSCGKKTDPISKDSLERAGLPVKFTVMPNDEGVLISNNEEAYLLVEKAAVQGDVCSEYSGPEIVEPKEKYLDVNVTSGQKYSYRFTKKTIKYGLLSDSVVRQVTYSAPPKVLSANINKTEKTLDIEIEPSAPFIRMDLYSNGKSIAQTGRTFMTVDLNGLAENISLTLTDRFGNKGQPYSIGLAPDRKQPEIPLVKGLGAVKFDKDLRVFWDSSKAESYVAEICDKGVCETVKTSLPYAVYQKQFDNCLDIAVYATSGEIKSAPATIQFCK